MLMRAAMLSALLVVLPGLATAQSAADIISEAEAAHQAMAEDVRSFTVEVGGETNRYERQEQDGHYVYRLSESNGMATAQDMPVMGFLDASYLEGLKEAAVYAGTETIDGVATHALRIDDPEQLAAYPGMEDQDFQSLRSMRLYLRTDNLMPARLMFEAVMPEQENQGPFQVGPGPITFVMDFRDYREVDGLVYPFVTEVSNDMVEQMSPEQRQMMEQMQARMEQQMAQMSPEQRQMMEERMGSRFEEMQAMMRGEPVQRTVTSLTVND